MADGHPGAGGQRPGRPGQGFFDAPWWRLLLWAVVFIVILFLTEDLGILG